MKLARLHIYAPPIPATSAEVNRKLWTCPLRALVVVFWFFLVVLGCIRNPLGFGSRWTSGAGGGCRRPQST